MASKAPAKKVAATSVTPVKKTVAKKVTKVTSPVAKTSVAVKKPINVEAAIKALDALQPAPKKAKSLPAQPVVKQTVRAQKAAAKKLNRVIETPIGCTPIKTVSTKAKPAVKAVVPPKKLPKPTAKQLAAKKAAEPVVPAVPNPSTAMGNKRTQAEVAADAKAFLASSRGVRQIKAAALKHGYIVDFIVTTKPAE